MKLQTFVLSLFTLCISSMCAQGTRGSDYQGGQRGNLSEPRAPNERVMDRRSLQQMDYTQSLDGEMRVLTPGGKKIKLIMRNGELQTAQKTMRQFSQELKNSENGDLFTFEFSNGETLSLIRTEQGFAPGNTNGEKEYYDKDTICWLLALWLSYWLIS